MLLKKGRFSPLLRRLLKTQRMIIMDLYPIPRMKRMHRLFKIRRNLYYPRRKLRLLSDTNGPSSPRPHKPHVPLRSVPLFTHALLFEERPATFQRVMNTILACLRLQVPLVYLDDVIIFSKTTADHLEHFDAVLQLLLRAGVSIRLDKCKFFSDQVEYLCHAILHGKLAVSSKTC